MYSETLFTRERAAAGRYRRALLERRAADAGGANREFRGCDCVSQSRYRRRRALRLADAGATGSGRAVARASPRSGARLAGAARTAAVAETVRRIIHTLIIDLITATARNIARVAPAHPDDVRRAPPLVAHSDAIAAQQRQLKQFLFKNLYRHYRVMRMTSKAQQIIRQLFNAFQHDPRLLPPDYQIQTMDMHAQARKIAHYIAGMTDRYALAEYRRLFVMETE